MYRELGTFEQAVMITNRHAPFNIVSVLKLENAPDPDKIRSALTRLQQRHPLLRARINEQNGKLVFEEDNSSQIPVEVIERAKPDLWHEIARREMAYSFNYKSAPLLRAFYIYKDGWGDLVLNFHHAIADGASGINLLDELLQLCAGLDPYLPSLKPLPSAEDRFPPPYKGLARVFNSGTYALTQMGDMLLYLWRTRSSRKAPVKSGGSGQIATLILPQDLVNNMARLGRRKGITLNSLMNAAMIMAANIHLYNRQPGYTRTFAFADLRPYTIPPTGTEDLGNYISMMSYTIEVRPEESIWELAGRLHQKIYRSLKKGDKFSASLLSKSIMMMFTRLKSMRMGITALNYTGNVPLQSEYGDIRVKGLHAFVSAIDLGPEFSSQARLLDDQIWMDFIYLDSDMDVVTADKIIQEIKHLLQQAVAAPPPA